MVLHATGKVDAWQRGAGKADSGSGYDVYDVEREAHRCRGTTRAYDARRACREPVGRPFRRLPERNVLRRVPLARQLPRIRRSESFLDDVMALPDVPHPLEFDRGHVRQVVASRSK